MKNRYLFWLLLVSCIVNASNITNVSSSISESKHEQNRFNKLDHKTTLKLLDAVLSPFEDMTEYALHENDKGMLDSLQEIEYKKRKLVFKDTLSMDGYTTLIKQIDQLRQYVNSKDYKKAALASTEIFHNNILYFKYAQLAKEQIIIEDMDYMGYKTLALVKQGKVDYTQIEALNVETMHRWNKLRVRVKDENMADSFDLVFKGIQKGCDQKNIDMLTIFASLDLTLVDVLEKQFQ